jgi:hypothetical protein
LKTNPSSNYSSNTFSAINSKGEVGIVGKIGGPIDGGEAEGDQSSTLSPAICIRKFYRHSLEEEVRAVAVWAIMLKETGTLIRRC